MYILEFSNFLWWMLILLFYQAIIFSSVQSLSCVWLFATPWIAAHQASLSITISRSSLRLTSIESVMPSSHLILGRPLILLPPIPPSIRVFTNESTLLMRWPKYRSFSFSIIPSKEIQGLISFRKGRGTRDQIANIAGSWKKQESSRKTSISALLTMPKPLTVWITINFGNFWKMEIPNHLTCLLRNLYAGQEETVRTEHGTTDWFQRGKGVRQGCILSPCLFN